MKTKRILLGLALIGLWGGCGGEPTEPLIDPELFPQRGAVHDEFTVTFPATGDISFAACANDGLGEDLMWFGDFYALYRIVYTPSGNELWKWKLAYSDPFGATGMTSGDEWLQVHSANAGGHMAVTNGCGFNEHWTNNEFYENQDGEKLHVQFLHQLTVTPNCEVKVSRDLVGCPQGR